MNIGATPRGAPFLIEPEMANIEFNDGSIHIDASILSIDLGVAVSAVQGLMRSGEITSLCERGVDADAGRHRLTFFHQNRRLRLIVDDAGNIIQRSTIDFGDRPLPAAMHKPNG
jgi:hypothetical protein